MFRIVAVEREYGSGAGSIAKALARRLDWKLWDRDITCEIARRLKCDVNAVEAREERLDPTFYRLVKVFMRGSYEDSTGNRLELLDSEQLHTMFEETVTELASKGNCVIVGRAAPWFLRDRDDCFSVFIYASYAEKMRRLVALGKSKEEAVHLIQTVDQERAAFVKKYHGKTWPQRDLYQLMLNSKVGDEVAIDTILKQMELLSTYSNAPVTALR